MKSNIILMRRMFQFQSLVDWFILHSSQDHLNMRPDVQKNAILILLQSVWDSIMIMDLVANVSF